ncbi:MAG: thiamine diphosphokinase [Streptococcaceae bacterium]|jgi:thiamine pyrophosphokinase|nr:thiamine diphosphokinase [Streptococcaceae bacterium]
MVDVVIVSGMVHSLPRLKAHYIGVDYGALFLVENDFPVEFAVGDFDSVSKEELERLKAQIKTVYQTASEKSDTDTQLALKLAIEKFPNARILIYGATGGRLDHLLSNLFLPLEERFRPFAAQIELFDLQNHVRYFLPGEHKIACDEQFKYLAFVPLLPALDFEIKGAKYQLSRSNILVPTSFASNEFIAQPVNFAFKTGVVCVIESNDESSLR